MLVIHAIPAYQRKVDIEVAVSAASDAVWIMGQGWQGGSIWADVHGVARARNLLVQQADAAGARLLLFQDSDSFPARDAQPGIASLWDAMCETGAAVVLAACPMRERATMACHPFEPNKVVDGAGGAAYMLIDLHKIRGIPRPLFVYETADDGCSVRQSEDYYFCNLVKSAGMRVVIDSRISMGHSVNTVNSVSYANAER